MAFLESMAPSVKKVTEDDFEEKSQKKSSRNRSRSRDRDDKRHKRKHRDRSDDEDDDRRHRKRSRSRDRKRNRSRSRERSRRSRSRDRSRRSRSRSRDRDNRGGQRGSSHVERAPPAEPEAGSVYNGKVANITGFGCFVALEGFRRKVEGLVHISQLRKEGRVSYSICSLVIRFKVPKSPIFWQEFKRIDSK